MWLSKGGCTTRAALSLLKRPHAVIVLETIVEEVVARDARTVKLVVYRASVSSTVLRGRVDAQTVGLVVRRASMSSTVLLRRVDAPIMCLFIGIVSVVTFVALVIVDGGVDALCFELIEEFRASGVLVIVVGILFVRIFSNVASFARASFSSVVLLGRVDALIM